LREIFRRNTDVVENPHWIYPGEVIRIWGDEVRPEAFASADSAGNVVSHIVTVPAPPPAPIQQSGGPELTVFASPLSRAAVEMEAHLINRSRTSGVRRGEVEAAPYVEKRGGPSGPGKLVASVDRPGIASNSLIAQFQLNDYVYFEPPRGFVARVGDRYLTYVLGDELANVGQIVIPTGIVRVESVVAGQPPKVRILRQFGEIKLEQGLIPFSDVILPPMGTNPIAGGASGKVLYVHNEPVLPSIGHYVARAAASKSGTNSASLMAQQDVAMRTRHLRSALARLRPFASRRSRPRRSSSARCSRRFAKEWRSSLLGKRPRAYCSGAITVKQSCQPLGLAALCFFEAGRRAKQLN